MPELRQKATERGTKLELVLDDQDVSGLEVVDLHIRIGDVPVRLGGIAGVYTRRDHRMKGYSRRVLEHSIEFMHQEGYHLAALFGIPGYYTKFGYAPALTGCEMTVATRDVEDAVVRFSARPFCTEDAPVVAALYEATHGCRTGSIVRDPATWPGIRLGAGWTDRVDTTVVVDGERVVGYFVHNLDAWRFGIGEVGYESPDVLSTLLGLVGRMALDLRVEKIGFHLPPDDAFARYCRRHGAEFRVTYPRHSSGMARIIRQDELLEAIQPLLARRLQASGREDRVATMVFETDLGTNMLALGSGHRNKKVALPQGMLAQFLLGYCPVQDLLFESGVRVEEEALGILDALFPSGYPFIWPADRF